MGLFSTNLSYTNNSLGLKIKKHGSFHKPYETLNYLWSQEAFLMHYFSSSYVPFPTGQSRCAMTTCKPLKPWMLHNTNLKHSSSKQLCPRNIISNSFLCYLHRDDTSWLVTIRFGRVFSIQWF